MSPTLFRLARIGGEAKPHPHCQTPTYPAGSCAVLELVCSPCVRDGSEETATTVCIGGGRVCV